MCVVVRTNSHVLKCSKQLVLLPWTENCKETDIEVKLPLIIAL